MREALLRQSYQKYRGDIHFVWCSEYFDSRKVGAYSHGSVIPPSSNPASLYKQLKEAAESEDEGDLKIIQQKNALKALAVDWEKAGHITTFEKEEIIVSIDEGHFKQWHPLIYLIPRVLVDSRNTCTQAKSGLIGNGVPNSGSKGLRV